MFILFTMIHPLIDACSMSVLVAGGMSWERVIAYNALAFALQLPLGVVMDEWPRVTCLGFFVGTGMAFAAAEVCLAVFAGVLGACVVVGSVLGATGKMPVVPVGVPSSTGKMPVVPVAGKMPATPIMGRMRVAPEVVLVGLFVLIAWRSWAGLFAGGRSADGSSLPLVLSCEIVIALFESFLLMSMYGFKRWRFLLAASFLMNTASYLTGVLIG